MKKMKISWIVPVFNAGNFLSEAISSILDDSCPGIEHEIIVVDDCSTDSVTILTLKNLQHHPLVKVFYQERNGGPSQARNRGIEAATGDWLTFLDADDLVAPGSIPARIAAIRGNAAIRWIVGDMLETRKPGEHTFLRCFERAVLDGKKLSTYLFKIENPSTKIASWDMLPFLGSMMIRRDLFKQVGFFNEELIYGEDIHFCLILSNLADMYWFNQPVLHLRRYHESMTKNLLRGAAEAPRASRYCMKDPRLKSIRKEMRWHYAANLRQSSGVFLQHRMRLKSIVYAARSVLWSPNDIRSLKALYKSFFS
jgi:glycosyltransferase involved in cell wall biosynthesis